MEQISFYLDEHIHRAVADGLRSRRVNVLTVQEAEKSGLSDREQLGFALSERRVMVTMDTCVSYLSFTPRLQPGDPRSFLSRRRTVSTVYPFVTVP